eukprot:CAMPEP_0171167566 /NCGR_PEP_ID=MMETSP0790-20130122/7270_1 /TAXON_ID=2925 /ORGANISM="Alexandrium catenella, Strain OF101" /LENGTH=324 /DNA_ID=CAMNT_0011632397 /DNA_START=62 /DNA_END=1037 /DNA_ORIENTATION=+
MTWLRRLACAACVALCGATTGSSLEDAAVLLQAEVGSHAAAGAGLLQGRASVLASLAASSGQVPGSPGGAAPTMMPNVNCAKSPWMCMPPFNCQQGLDVGKLFTTLATEDGHTNLRSWCLEPQFADTLVKHCLWLKDQKTAAQEMYLSTIHGKHGPFTAEADASYCFIEGHCSNTAVTFNTTLEEAEQMCDFRYGHDAWAKDFGLKDIIANPKMAPLVLAGGATPKGGFKHADLVGPFLKAACAMGNYHCDINYCKETYCKEEYYIKKYGHLLPKAQATLSSSAIGSNEPRSPCDATGQTAGMRTKSRSAATCCPVSQATSSSA